MSAKFILSTYAYSQVLTEARNVFFAEEHAADVFYGVDAKFAGLGHSLGNIVSSLTEERKKLNERVKAIFDNKLTESKRKKRLESLRKEECSKLDAQGKLLLEHFFGRVVEELREKLQSAFGQAERTQWIEEAEEFKQVMLEKAGYVEEGRLIQHLAHGIAKAQAREKFYAWKIKWVSLKNTSERVRSAEGKHLEKLIELLEAAKRVGDNDLAKEIVFERVTQGFNFNWSPAERSAEVKKLGDVFKLTESKREKIQDLYDKWQARLEQLKAEQPEATKEKGEASNQEIKELHAKTESDSIMRKSGPTTAPAKPAAAPARPAANDVSDGTDAGDDKSNEQVPLSSRENEVTPVARGFGSGDFYTLFPQGPRIEELELAAENPIFLEDIMEDSAQGDGSRSRFVAVVVMAGIVVVVLFAFLFHRYCVRVRRRRSRKVVLPRYGGRSPVARRHHAGYGYGRAPHSAGASRARSERGPALGGQQKVVVRVVRLSQSARPHSNYPKGFLRQRTVGRPEVDH